MMCTALSLIRSLIWLPEIKGEIMKTVIVNLVKRIFLIVMSPFMLITKIGGPEYGNFTFSEWWHLMKHPEQL